MKCPFCGKEMDDGYVRGNTPTPFRRSALYWNDEAYEMTGQNEWQELFVEFHDYGCPGVTAHKCDDCRKIIMESYIVED